MTSGGLTEKSYDIRLVTSSAHMMRRRVPHLSMSDLCRSGHRFILLDATRTVMIASGM